MRPYFAMPEDGWYNIAIAGEFPHSTGYIQVLDADAFHAIVEDVHQQMGRPNWPGILVDFDHDSLDASKPSAAAGWLVDIAERPDGLWAKIRWSDMGQKALEGGSFRFVSPVWLLEDCEELGEKRVRPKKLMNCAITNCPNIKGMIPLTNRADAAAPRFAPPGRALPVVDCVEVPRAELAALGAFLRNDARQPMTDEQRKAMFARLGGPGGLDSRGTGAEAYADGASAAATSTPDDQTQTTTRSDYEAPFREVVDRYGLDIGYSDTGISSASVRIHNLEAEKESLQKQIREPPEPPATRYKSLSQARREAARKPGATSDSILAAVEAAKEANDRYSKYRREIAHIKHTIPKGASQNAALNRAERLYLSSYNSELLATQRHNDAVERRIAEIDTQIAQTAYNARSAIDREKKQQETAETKAAAKAQAEAARASKQAAEAERKRLEAAERQQAREEAARAKAAEKKAKAQAKAAAKAEKEAQAQAAADIKAAAKAQAQAQKQAAKEADPAYRRSKYAEAVQNGDMATAERLYPGQNHQQHAANIAELSKTNKADVKKRNIAMYLESRLGNALPNAMTDEQRRAMFARLKGQGITAYDATGRAAAEAPSLRDKAAAVYSGFSQGANEGAENVLNAYTFGATDRMGLTHTYEQTGAASEFSKMMAGLSALAAYTATGAQLAGVGGGVGIGGGASAAEAAGSAALRQYAADQAAEDYFTKSSANEFLEMSRDYVRNSFDLEEALSKLDEVAQNMKWAGLAGDEGVTFKLGDMWYQTPVSNLGGAWQADPGRAGMSFFEGVGGVEPKLADVMAGLENALTRYSNGFPNYVR